MTRLLLVRHGQTVGNINQVLQGQQQGELTEEGRSQARLVRDKLMNEHIDAFIASDLKRAVDTCSIIAQPHHAQLTTTPLLRERDWGDFTGQLIPEIKDKVWPENVESLEAMKNRAAQFLEMVKSHYPEMTVLAVGHGIINKAIQAVYYNKPMHEVQKMTNAEIRELTI